MRHKHRHMFSPHLYIGTKYNTFALYTFFLLLIFLLYNRKRNALTPNEVATSNAFSTILYLFNIWQNIMVNKTPKKKEKQILWEIAKVDDLKFIAF